MKKIVKWVGKGQKYDLRTLEKILVLILFLGLLSACSVPVKLQGPNGDIVECTRDPHPLALAADIGLLALGATGGVYNWAGFSTISAADRQINCIAQYNAEGYIVKK